MACVMIMGQPTLTVAASGTAVGCGLTKQSTLAFSGTMQTMLP
jgi:hypothetical protein